MVMSALVGDSQKRTGEVARRRQEGGGRPNSQALDRYLTPLEPRTPEMESGGHQWPGEHGGPACVGATTGNVLGRSHDDAQRLRPDPQALSHPVISYEPLTRGWLHEAINGLVCQEAV